MGSDIALAFLDMDDAHSAMLALATEFEEKEAAGKQVSADEQVVADVVWIDVQVVQTVLTDGSIARRTSVCGKLLMRSRQWVARALRCS